MSAARLPILLAASLALLVAGCVAPPAADVETAAAGLGLDLMAAAEPLWLDPQNAPHPAFGWPTLTNPATGAGVSPWWAPAAAAELPAEIAGIDFLATTEGVGSGGGIALFGSLGIVPGLGETSYIVDISDPTTPTLLSEFKVSKGGHRGAAVIAYPDGRLVATFATGAGFEVFDITDPTSPEHLADVDSPTGGHKLGVVPGTPYVYNANSAGGGTGPLGIVPVGHMPATATGQTEIYDLTDPANPVLVQEFKNGYGCHHIYFWNSAEKQRAICAGIEMTQIWDIADPAAPTVIVNVPVHHGVAAAPSASVFLMAFSHFAILNAAGDILIVGDEMMGGLPPGCTAPGAPTGALWFYDVSTETDPKLLGWFSPGHHLQPTKFSSCTAHHGRLVPDPAGEKQLLAMAFYGAGTVLVDFTNPMMPKAVDQWNDGASTWETWYYNGYLFTGDMARGFDVLKFS